jgi:hypothetical protein
MWGTREPPDWLAKRWPCKHDNNKGNSGVGGGEGDAGESKAEGGDVEAGGQRGASGWAPTGIRLPPIPVVRLPEVSTAPSSQGCQRHRPV